MYHSQYILNGDTNIWRVARGLDPDKCRITLAISKLKGQHRWVSSGGGESFFGKVIVGVDRLAKVKFEKEFRQYGVYDERGWLSLVLSSLVHYQCC